MAPSVRRNHHAFTLIELLVVVAIIALLVSILLPSLAKAREQARAAVCAARFEQTGRAELGYQTENKEWIPGSPWSTGYWLTRTQVTTWNPLTPGFPRLVLDWYDYATPLRASMQGPRSIPRPTATKDIDSCRSSMFRLTTAEPFQCPSNNQMAVPYGGPGPVIKAVSMLTMWSIMRAGPAAYDDISSNPSKYPGVTAGHIAQSSSWQMRVPSGYMPRHSRLGRESMKVFMADGLRYFTDFSPNHDGVSGTVDYDVSAGCRASKGISNIDEPPSTAGAQFNSMYNLARRYAYRHGNNDRMDALFFDGHVEGMTVNYRNAPPDLTGFTGTAVHPKWYYPSGTVVTDSSYNHLKIPAGTVLP